ncbi:hypothetical protein D3C76_1367750 [compost metagenome]
MLGPIRRISASAGIQIADRKIGSGPKEGTALQVETPTHLAGTIDFAEGAIATMITSFDIRGASDLPRIEIYGTEGTLSVPDPNYFNGEVKVRRYGQDTWETVKPVFESGQNERGIGVTEMVESIRAGREHKASGKLAYHVLEAMHAFQRSSLEGKHVMLESTYDPNAATKENEDPTEIVKSN